MPSMLELRTEVIPVQLMILLAEWKRYLTEKGIINRRTKSKICKTTEEFRKLYAQYCAMTEVGKASPLDTGLADKLLHNLLSSIKLEALGTFICILKEVISKFESDRITTLKFYSAVEQAIKEYNDNLIGSLKSVVHAELLSVED